MASTVAELTKEYPCRKQQIQQLCELFGYPDEPYPPTIFVYGGTSTGKSSILKAVLDHFSVKYVIVNLNECYSSKILFETVLNKFAEFHVDPTKGQSYAKCDNIMDFITHFKACAEAFALESPVLVLDKADQLRQMDHNLLSSFLRMRELTGLSISVILVSEIIPEKFQGRGNVIQAIKVYFPQYTREELLSILALDFPNAKVSIFNTYKRDLDINVEFYKNYLSVFLSVFFRACRDLSELRHMSRINFVDYCRPIVNGEYKPDDSMALWRHVAPILKSSLEVLYLRLSMEENKVDQIQKHLAFSKENLAQSLELPFYAKYLLIAAYLASYNPAKDDKRLFMKYHGKKTKTRKDIKSKSKVSEQLNTQMGPKAFSLDRLLAIFYAILEDKMGFNNNLLVQASSLVELQLLTSLSDNFSLDGQKYKCVVSFEFIQTISKMVGFNIRKYLSDFSHM